MSLVQAVPVHHGFVAFQTPLSAPAGPVLSICQDGPIYREGDDAKSYYKVISGVVRTCKFFSDGRRQIDEFYQGGDLFGIESGVSHSLSAEAVSDCVVVVYRRSDFVNDQQRAGQMFAAMLTCLEHAQAHALLLGRCSAVQKIASFLLDRAEMIKGEQAVDLAMTRLDIADYLGLTIETVSRTMTQLDREGIIGLPTARRVLILDHDALLDLTE
jgi:CRP/FNR family nitrogen fixation transcriptional regulator